MAFQALPKTVRGFRGPAPSNIPTIAIFDDYQTKMSVPRGLLREAGLPDIPGAKFDVLVGTGPDAGTIALIAGSSSTGTKLGTSANPTRLAIRISNLHQKGRRFKSQPMTFEIGRRQIIFALPFDFPQAPVVEAEKPDLIGRPSLSLGAAA